MGRILAIDYGSKRVGLAVTDPLRIIARALDTVHVKDIQAYLKHYISNETVDVIVLGEPKTLLNTPSLSARFINPFAVYLQRQFPEIPLIRWDERFTTQLAKQSLLENGVKKKQRENKQQLDQISAVILLQDYLNFLNQSVL
jgi:putative Holliday junction resolvase